MRRHQALVLWLVTAGVALLAAALVINHTSASPSNARSAAALPANATPQEVAQTFFRLCAANDAAAARRLIWHPRRGGVAPDPYGFGGIEGLSVGDGRIERRDSNSREYRGFADLWGLPANYRTVDGARTPTECSTWVVLGRETATSAWLILEILGSGP